MTRTHHGRIAVISGAASGIGQASAVRLAEEGARIVVADRENAKQTLDLITAAGGIATAIVCDVSDPASVAALKNAVEANIGLCDILVNNAGIYPTQRFDEITFEDWRRVLSVNLDSMFLMIKSFCRRHATARVGARDQYCVGYREPSCAGIRSLYHEQGRRNRVYTIDRNRVRRPGRHCECNRPGAYADSGLALA
jgi:NAD(P)-dependent dehydrogenase (short-subunit alcohol dehydrogenase family)